MNAATIAGVASTLLFAGSTLPMVLRAARSRDVSSYSRSHLVMTNAGNAMHTVYVASLPPGPIWLLHGVHSAVAAFMVAVHLRWTPQDDPAATVAQRDRWVRTVVPVGEELPPGALATGSQHGSSEPLMHW